MPYSTASADQASISSYKPLLSSSTTEPKRRSFFSRSKATTSSHRASSSAAQQQQGDALDMLYKKYPMMGVSGGRR